MIKKPITDLRGKDFELNSKTLLAVHPQTHQKILKIIQKSLS